MSIDVDFSRTHEVIEMLNLIYDSVEEGCKDRCYIDTDSAKEATDEADIT